MSSGLYCYVRQDDYRSTFQVKIGMEESVAALKNAIKEKNKPAFDHVPARSLVLWNTSVPFSQNLEKDVEALNLNDNDALQPLDILSNIFPSKLEKGIVHIVVDCLPSANSNIFFSPPSWLLEIHCKLWGKHELFGQIFRTANLTRADFIELQCQLQEQNLDRNTESYEAINVLATKSAFLRSRSTTDVVNDAPFVAGLVPQLVFGASQGLTQLRSSDVVDEDTDDADAVADDIMEIDPDSCSSGCSYIYSDADCLSTGTTTIFPCTIRYIDLTVLELEKEIRVPQLMLFRKEWDDVIYIFNKRKEGIKGSAILTGQPGIGKTCFLYSILIHCIIRAQPIVFQDMRGNVFIINDTVSQQMDIPVIPGRDVLTLVDAEGAWCQPDPNLLEASNLRILVTSSPMERKDRKWLTQSVGETGAMFVMEPWSREELLVTSLFLARIDITLKRSQDASNICGFIPRPCFEAAESPYKLREAETVIIETIKGIELSEAPVNLHSGAIKHRVFQIRPSSPSWRSWYACSTEAVSDWAFSKMMAHLDYRSGDDAYKLYRAIQGSTHSSLLGRKMFETKVHPLFRSITKPRTFTIRSLDDCSTTLNIEFSSNTEHRTFEAIPHFAGQLALFVESHKSCYLQPRVGDFPTFDSFLYQDGISRSGFSSLIGLQITTASTHPISVKGLERIQRSLNSKNAHLKDLQPLQDRKMIILFVVPDTMGASFLKQTIEDAERVGHWYEKTSQYVLTLSEKEVFQSI